MAAVFVLCALFGGVLSQMPTAIPGSMGPLGNVGNPVPTISPHNLVDVGRLLPPNMLPQTPLQSPLGPGVALSTAIRQIQSSGFQPNFDQRDFGNVLGNFPLPQFMPGNGFNGGNQIDSHGIFPGHAELLEELNRFDREMAPGLSEEMNFPPWLTNTFSDRFRNPFDAGLPNSNIQPPPPIMPLSNGIGAVVPPTMSTLPGGKNLNSPLKTDLLPPPDLKIESFDKSSKLKISTESKKNLLKKKIEPPMRPPFPYVNSIDDIQDIGLFLDDIFQKEVPKIPCSLRLYPAYKRVMVNLLQDFSLGARLDINLFVMLWRDLKICGRFKLSKTNRLIKKLQRYERKRSKDDDSNERRGSKLSRNVIKKRIYLQKTLAKRFRVHDRIRGREIKIRRGSSSSGGSRSEESGSSEEWRRGGAGSRRRLNRGRWNKSGSSSGGSSNESD